MDEREKIRHQIEYDWLREQFRAEPIDELVEIMLEVAMNRSPTIRIGRDAEYPTSYVQERFSKITAMHIECVMEGIADNRTQVRNTRAYLLASLFNSVSTLDNQCTCNTTTILAAPGEPLFYARTPGERKENEKASRVYYRPLGRNH